MVHALELFVFTAIENVVAAPDKAIVCELLPALSFSVSVPE